jgi:hypothetical protein
MTFQQELATDAIQILTYTVQLCSKEHQMLLPRILVPAQYKFERSNFKELLKKLYRNI